MIWQEKRAANISGAFFIGLHNFPISYKISYKTPPHIITDKVSPLKLNYSRKYTYISISKGVKRNLLSRNSLIQSAELKSELFFK